MTTVTAITVTARQFAVARWIATYSLERGHPPAIREVQKHFGYVSPNGVMTHLHPLRRKGVVTWAGRHARTLRVIVDLDALEVVS